MVSSHNLIIHLSEVSLIFNLHHSKHPLVDRRMPCKHIFDVLHHKHDEWQFEKLPRSLLSQCHLVVDPSVLPSTYQVPSFQVCSRPVLGAPLSLVVFAFGSGGVHVICQSLVLDVLCHYQQVSAFLIYKAFVYNYTLFYSQEADGSNPGSDAGGDDILDMVDTLQVILAEPPEPLERPSLPPPPEEAATAVQPAVSAGERQDGQAH
jgi:hypothetical protein